MPMLPSFTAHVYSLGIMGLLVVLLVCWMPYYTPALLRATQDGDVDRVRMLVQEERVNANQRRYWVLGETPLLVAAQGGYSEIVQLLIQGGADTMIEGMYGTPLHTAARFGHTRVVRSLLDADSDPNHPDTTNGLYPLHLAAFHGHLDVLHELLKAGAQVDLTAPKDGLTPLFYASWQGHTEVVDALVHAGALVDRELGTTRYTALRQAVFEGHVSVVRILLDAGADPSRYDGNNQTTLDVACSVAKDEVALLLLRRGAKGEEALVWAAFHGLEAVVHELLLTQKADPNYCAPGGTTALLAATVRGHIRIIELLLATGHVNVHHKDDAGWDAVGIAQRKGYEQIVTLLREHESHPR